MDTLEHELSEVEFPRAPHRRRRAAAIVFVGAAFFALVGSFLATSSTFGPTISPPAGTPTSGNIADVTNYSSPVNRTNGAAQLQVGVTLGKIVVSKMLTNAIQVIIDWTNTSQAVKVLNNPNAQISIGLYHPVSNGPCPSTTPSVDEPLVTILDSDNNSYCVALDQQATGQFASSTGKLLLAQNQVGGFLTPSLDESAQSSPNCGSGTVAWCQPLSLQSSDSATAALMANQRVLFVVASIVTPGGVPQGQQPSISTLSFYIGVNARG